MVRGRSYADWSTEEAEMVGCVPRRCVWSYFGKDRACRHSYPVRRCYLP